MPGAETPPGTQTDDHSGLIEAEEKEAEVEEKREERAIDRTDRATQEYEAEKNSPA
jgi:hypothetical protein